MGYRPEQRTLTGFASSCDKNLIWSFKVQNEIDYVKVFLLRSLAILEENGQRHQESLSKVTLLEVEVANVIDAFVEAVQPNHSLLSKVGGVLSKLMCTRLHGNKCLGVARTY